MPFQESILKRNRSPPSFVDWLQQSPGGVATAQQYTQLLALHLLHNEICEAKFVWKRIPAQIKTSTPELTNEWSEALKPVMDALLAATRKRAFNLVAQAYDSINVDDLAAFVGMPSSEAAQGIIDISRETTEINVLCLTNIIISLAICHQMQPKQYRRKADADPQTRFITPRKPCKYSVSSKP
ncbi:COPS8 [Mytilus edulis]|uniref:COPS8 n=1 Tax=Mytilus edulis TaxID=6550 RepID=A0A8S3UNB5_MYTED|nr:COPS8 [Mytilus edulis]